MTHAHNTQAQITKHMNVCIVRIEPGTAVTSPPCRQIGSHVNNIAQLTTFELSAILRAVLCACAFIVFYMCMPVTVCVCADAAPRVGSPEGSRGGAAGARGRARDAPSVSLTGASRTTRATATRLLLRIVLLKNYKNVLLVNKLLKC